MQQKQIILLILDFLEGICDQEYMFQKFTFIKSSHWNMCHVFPKRWMARVNNCLVSPLLGKALYLEFLIHTDPKLFWIVCQNGHSDLLQFGICLFLILLCAFIALPEMTKFLILFFLYKCLPDTFWTITSSGTYLFSVGKWGTGCFVFCKGIFIWKEERKVTFA